MTTLRRPSALVLWSARTLLVLLLISAHAALAQVPGSLDLSFDPGTGTGSNGIVYDMVLQADGRVLIGGQFTQYNGIARPNLARVLADGSLDTSFDPGTGPNNPVIAQAVQPDGKIVIGGLFSTYNGVARRRIARLNSDGSLDTGFNVGTGFAGTGSVEAITLQPDGKILVSGYFPSYNGIARNNIVRLNSDGSLDTSFLTDPGPDDVVIGIELQPDGRMIIFGTFQNINGNPRVRIARLLPNGALDTSFDPGSGAFGTIRAASIQPDGRIMIGGGFIEYDGTARTRLARLNANGSLDPSFNPAVGPNGDVLDLQLQANGKVIIAGLFGTYRNTLRRNLARVNSDGSLDPSFAPGAGANFGLNCVTPQADGRILIGGHLNAYAGASRQGVARVNGGEALLIAARVLLHGPYNTGTGLMNDGLRTAGLLPVNEPYAGLGFVHVGGGGEHLHAPLLSTTGANAIVDWVVLELRDANVPATRLLTRSALLQRDGDVVELDGTSPVALPVASGNYSLAIQHRNHLGVMTANTVTLSATTATVDLTLASTPTQGTDARWSLGNVMVLWPGDGNGDGVVRYSGATNDRDLVLSAIGGAVPTNTLSGQYRREDINLDGVVKYAGPDNDRDFILQTIGGSVPTAVRVEQVP
jgi:uncharacterized delta-60 repeat protein